MSQPKFAPHERDRFFIINLGRTGSSLLAAVLADASANFGIDPPVAWDPRKGQMEYPAIKRAAHHYRRAHDIGDGRKFFISPALETKYRLARGRRHLRDALAACRYLKIGDLDLVVQPCFKLGYRPRVILNYRRLEPMLPSLLVGRTHTGPDRLAEEYVRVYRQGLVLAHTFGGATVAYNELQDGEASGWAHALAALTGLDADALLDSRARRLDGVADRDDAITVYAEADALYRTLRTTSGRAIAGSRQYERALSRNA